MRAEGAAVENEWAATGAIGCRDGTRIVHDDVGADHAQTGAAVVADGEKVDTQSLGTQGIIPRR